MHPALLHQTDLFRPHNDPDDHWDLACAFAIAKRGLTLLEGVLIDHPPGPPILNHASDPDVGAVAQLAHLTGISPPISVGSPKLFSARRDLRSAPVPKGVEFITRLLRESVDKIAISIVGSARDIAEALVREPQLFAEKCDRIYLVAGSGSPDPAKVKSLEWNVALDPAAYAQIFQAPCSLYWLPCLEDEDRVASEKSRAYAGHFLFSQREVLADLPSGLRSYFGFMYEKRESSAWLRALDESFSDVLRKQGDHQRMMYSTPLFFDVAGLGVTTRGEARPKNEKRDDWVYQFEPARVHCNADGVTSWEPSSVSNRHVFHVLDTDAYPIAMTRAMKTLLSGAFE